MPDLIKLVRCRLCNGDFSTEVLKLKPTPNQKELLHKAITLKEKGHRKYNKIIIL